MASRLATPRPARLASARAGLVRLHGFEEALARLSGRPVSAFRSKPGFKDTCRAVAEAHPGLDPRPSLIAVKQGRKTIGHRIEADIDAIRIAHGVNANATMDAWVVGPMPRKLVRRYGLRDGRERPWAKDPVEAERRRGLMDFFARSWGTTNAFPESPDSTWRAALIFPLRGKPTPDYVPTVKGKGLIVVSRDGHDAAFLRMPPQRKGRTAKDVEAAIKAGIPLDATSTYDLQVGPDVHAMHDIAGIEERKSVGESTWHRILYILHRRAVGAITQFRAALPAAVSDHVGLLPIRWDHVSDVALSFGRRRGWTALHYERCNQAVRVVPSLRYALASSDEAIFGRTWKAIVDGKPIEAAIRAAASIPSPAPLHPKAVRALSGFWPRQHGRVIRGAPVGTMLGDVATIVEGLDIHAKADPHRPVPTKQQVQTLFTNVARCRTSVPPVFVAGMLSACRDGKGRVAAFPNEFADVVQWVRNACDDLAAHCQDGDTATTRRISDLAAVSILFPAKRTLKGIERVNIDWHAHVNRHSAAVRAIKAQAEQVALKRFPRSVVDALYPHFLKGPIAIGDVSIAPLLNAGSLAEEGDELSHCVGTYVHSASRGHSMIASLRSPAGRSTAEIVVSTSARRPRLLVVQHQGPRNTEPPQAHDAALKAAMDGKDIRSPRDLLKAIETANHAASQVERAIEEAITEEIGAQIHDATWAFLGKISKGSHRDVAMKDWFARLASRVQPPAA